MILRYISLHAVTFMLRKVDLSVMLIVDLTLITVVQHSPFQFHGFAYAIQVISVPKLSFRLRTDRSSMAKHCNQAIPH